MSQYYKLEQSTDLFSLNTGKVMAKVGWNDKRNDIKKSPVSFMIIDSKPHLTQRGIDNLTKHVKKLYIVTTNKEHPAFMNSSSNLEAILYEKKIDFEDLLKRLKSQGIDRITIQSGGELNSQLIRQKLINYVSIVVVPMLVGGKDTPTLVDGPSFETFASLQWIGFLKLLKVDQLKDSYLHLFYKVI